VSIICAVPVKDLVNAKQRLTAALGPLRPGSVGGDKLRGVYRNPTTAQNLLEREGDSSDCLQCNIAGTHARVLRHEGRNRQLGE